VKVALTADCSDRCGAALSNLDLGQTLQAFDNLLPTGQTGGSADLLQ
jgi:hypothetical protein